MARPKILRETKRPVQDREPPPNSTLRPHPWLSEDSLTEFRSRLRYGDPFDIYLSGLAEAKIRNHAEKEASSRLEVMGFLLGETHAWRRRAYTVVLDAVTTELKSSSSKVRFDPKAFPKLFHELDEAQFDYVLVGWYHSHPGHTCFLSGTDLETQRTFFDQPYHTALVVDPVNKEMKTFRLSGDGYEELPFALFDSERQTAGKARAAKTRKLKVTPLPAALR